MSALSAPPRPRGARLGFKRARRTLRTLNFNIEITTPESLQSLGDSYFHIEISIRNIFQALSSFMEVRAFRPRLRGARLALKTPQCDLSHDTQGG